MRSLNQYGETLIAVLGGGPAGLSAALRATELGFKVDLYEQKKIGSGIKCAEGFIDTLGILGKPEAGVLYRVKKAVLSAGKAHTVHFGKNCGFWMIDRTTWQRAMAKKARLAKVRIDEDFPIGRSQLWDIVNKYHYVIDASGAPSITSRVHGFVPAYLENASLLAQYLVEGDFSFIGKDTVKVGYEPHYIGYYYIFPKGPHLANVGVGRYNRGKRRGHIGLQRELDRILRKERIDGYRIRKKTSSFVPANRLGKLVWGKILLVGDAAALCSPLHGGGIDLACISGRTAADSIASNQVCKYPNRLMDVVGCKLSMERRICALWHTFGYSFLIGILKFPPLFRGIFFNKHPIPQILGIGGKKRWHSISSVN